ncbi:hypothetical protein Vadar_017211 [Vaccinium darrowii]|uniref:Uncharacterized protein n=1 Tax=Vaccinium darrowii TaxID=229202 RepID=A0ACB7XRZ1_9ERIC|nr:hypothetical protein Vadar_017211 [Vaccinium darrowii]
MPWVMDFSVEPEETLDTGWRYLSKSKWRLTKGDEPLDFTYKARRLPVSVLRMAVHSVCEPNEYPSSMLRGCTNEPLTIECNPDFYCDPQSKYGENKLAHKEYDGVLEVERREQLLWYNSKITVAEKRY